MEFEFENLEYLDPVSTRETGLAAAIWSVHRPVDFEEDRISRAERSCNGPEDRIRLSSPRVAGPGTQDFTRCQTFTYQFGQ